MIARRFMANCSKDALLNQQDIKVDVSNEIFTARGTQVVEANFLTIYSKYMAVEEKTLPGFEDGEELTPSQLTLDEGKTTAPSLLNESDLIGLMDKNEIGTDATIHEHVKTIQD